MLSAFFLQNVINSKKKKKKKKKKIKQNFLSLKKTVATALMHVPGCYSVRDCYVINGCYGVGSCYVIKWLL
jgi:hypothetical protein